RTTVTDPYNKTWTTAYDLAGRKTAATDPLGHVTSFAYDNNNNLTSTTDGRGKVTSYVYDFANNRTSVTDPNLKTTAFVYDLNRRLASVTDAANGVTAYGYDDNGNRTSLTDARGHTRTWTYDDNNRMVSETDALGKTTTYAYDGAGNRTKRLDANGAITGYTYDAINRLTAIRYATGAVSHAYDTANRRTSMTDSTGTTTYAYDELDRLSSVTFPGNKVVSYQYDAAGNRTRITYPDGKTVDYAYDDANRLSTVTDWLTKVTTYGYDDAGRLTSTAYPTGVTEIRSYNNADQLASIVAGTGGPPLTSFAYTLDNAGIRTAVQDLAGAESYTYDNLYRITGVTYSDQTAQSYTYDAVGNRLTRVQGGTTSYTYDNGDRMTAAGSATYTYDNNGSQKSVTSGGTTTTDCWDVFNRLIQVTDSSSAPLCPVAPVRLNAGGATYVDGAGNNWFPDTFFSMGMAGSTSSAIANTTDDALYQKYRHGGAFSYAIPLSEAGDYTVKLKFNEPNYSAAGQRKFDVSLEGNLVLDDFDVYAAAGGRNIAVDRTFTVAVSDGALNVSFTGVVNNALVSAIEVVWAGGAPATPTASFAYRGDGLRHSKTVGGNTTTYTWDVNSKLPVILQDGSYTYVYGVGLISQTDNSGVQSYFLTNGLGSTEALTDGSGNVTATYKYDVFGAVRSSSGAGSTEYRFTGQQDDATLGYTYLRARYYDPATGRFISKDPFRGFARSPGSQNPYTYVQDSATNATDPTGQSSRWCTPCEVVGGVVGGGSPTIGEILGAIAAGTGGVAIWAMLSAWLSGADVGSQSIAGEPGSPNPDPTPTAGFGDGLEFHHLLPQQFKSYFERAGLNIDEFVIRIPAGDHRFNPNGLHTIRGGNWNRVWRDFRDAHPQAEAPEILEQLARMVVQFGLG
ncbi:MAG: DUF2380 domain-containing protein, partial [Chloroflexi bacterium]|nr:DUF2380 domain-containing protein [Chloroflexota bacterium]